MDIDKRAQPLRRFPERIERLVIEIKPIGMAVDHCAFETELPHATFELARSGFGILHRDVRKARIAIGPAGDDIGQKIVRLNGALGRYHSIALGLHART